MLAAITDTIRSVIEITLYPCIYNKHTAHKLKKKTAVYLPIGIKFYLSFTVHNCMYTAMYTGRL